MVVLTGGIGRPLAGAQGKCGSFADTFGVPVYLAGVGAGAGSQRLGEWPVDDRPFHMRYDAQGAYIVEVAGW